MQPKNIVSLIKEAIKRPLEEMIRAEREEYLKQHPQTKSKRALRKRFKNQR